MLKSDGKVLVSRALVQQFEEINKAVGKCCELALQQRLPDKQIAWMTDTRFTAAGYSSLTEDDPHKKITFLCKSNASVVYGSKK